MRKSFLPYVFIFMIAVLFASARAEEGDKQPSPQAKTAASAEDREREEREERERDVREERERDENRYKDDDMDRDEDEGDDDREEQHASAVILITSNPHTFKIDPDAIGYLLGETDWLAEDDLEMEIDFKPLPCGREGSVIGVLRVEIEGDEKIDPKLLKNISNRLQTVLVNLAKAASMEPFAATKESMDQEAKIARGRAEELSRHAEEIRNRLLQEGIVSDELGEHIAMLQRERFQMQVELAGLRARHETLMPRIALTAKKMEKAKAAAQLGLKRMQAAIEVYAMNLKRLREANKKVAGSVPQSDIEAAEAEVLLAKAELEERRHEINREFEGGMLGGLNEQVVQVEVERKSIEARLEVISKRLALFQNKELLKLTGTFRQVNRKLEEARRRCQAAAADLTELESQQSRMQLPRVKILRPAELLEQK